MPDAEIVRREATDGDGRECVAQRVEESHTGKHVAGQAHQGEDDVDIPERFCRLGDTRCELRILDRPGRFGAQ